MHKQIFQKGGGAKTQDNPKLRTVGNSFFLKHLIYKQQWLVKISFKPSCSLNRPTFTMQGYFVIQCICLFINAHVCINICLDSLLTISSLYLMIYKSSLRELTLDT